MQRRSRRNGLVFLVAGVAALGFVGIASAQTSAFDRGKAIATSKQISEQVTHLRGEIGTSDSVLANDLRELEGHSDHLREGLHAGLGEMVTAPVLKRVVELTLAVNERANADSVAAGPMKSMAAIQASVVQLEALYGIDVASAPPKPPAPTVQKADPCREKVRLIGVEFELDSAKVTEASAATLGVAVEKLKNCSGIAVQIDGYTDSTGPANYNAKLSQERAESVRAYLVEKGIGADRLSAKGDGEADPIASNATTAGRAENRRVELTPKS